MKEINNIIHEVNACRICGNRNLKPVLNLGDQYLSGLFMRENAPEFLLTRFPLQLVRCFGPNGCGLVQLKHTISPKILYYDYGYRSGINEVMRKNLLDIANKAKKMVDLKDNDIILDIGCNDGTLLDYFSNNKIQKVGVDPAKNVAEIAKKKGFEVISDLFSAEIFNRVKDNRKAKIVTSIAVFYDLEDPLAFTKDVASILSEDGLWVIELSYLPFMLKNTSFDTICHEHLEYYSLFQLEWLLNKCDLKVQKIQFNDINGGSIRLFIKKVCAYNPIPEQIEEIERVRKFEKEFKLNELKIFNNFEKKSLETRNRLLDAISQIKKSKRQIYIYGASTKGNVILQFCGIDNKIINKAADRNPAKWGRKTLGTNIQIISEKQAREENPDYFLVLPWHFINAFIKREKKYLKNGGKFIVPLPEFKIIGYDEENY